MKRMLIEALLIALVAGGVWFYRGTASTGIGPVSITCQAGEIARAEASENGASGSVRIRWGEISYNPGMNGAATFTDCMIEPEP